MKENQTTRIGCAFAILLLAGASALAQEPLGSEFTYQGQLKLAGEVLNDTADFEFTLWDADTVGNMIGAVVAVNNVTVTDGLFTVELDFGVLAFNGENRWLEIDVRSPAGSGPFTTLSPRQPLTAIPYSLQTRGLFVDNAGNVGIGTNSPMSRLHVAGDGMFTGGDLSVWFGNKAVTLRQDGNTTFLSNKADFVGNGAESNGLLIINGEGGIALRYGSALSSGTDALIVDTSGNVGIGTTTPDSKLEVTDTIRVSRPGAPQQRIEILRGSVNT